MIFEAQHQTQADCSGHLLGPNGDKPSIGPALWGTAADFGPHEQAEVESGHIECVIDRPNGASLSGVPGVRTHRKVRCFPPHRQRYF